MKKIIRWILPKAKKRVEGEEAFICNLKKDKVDKRDFIAKAAPLETLPKKVSLRQYCPPVKSQGRIGSCGSHAFATAYEMMLRKERPDWFIEQSELFHYYVVRSPEYMNTLPKDSGQYLRDGARVLNKVGIAPESLCPYNYNKYNDKPGLFAYSFARFWKIKAYEKCYDMQAIYSELASGKPVVFGAKVYESFMLNRDGEIKMPITNDRYAGGHAMCIIGYDDDNQAFEVINSWSTIWGKRGYCWIPYKWMEKYLLDAWTMTL